MDILQLLYARLSKNEITFPERYFVSNDKKTIMGEVPFSEILFLDYRDTEAGSNPREFIGIKNTNINILKSLLVEPKNLFRFLHSGIIVSLIGTTFENNSIFFEECCLTNGNQTRFIILAIVFLKLYFDKSPLKSLKQNDIKVFLKKHFKDNPTSDTVFNYLHHNKLNQVINFLENNNKYYELYRTLDIANFIYCRIRIQLNLVNNILEDLEDNADTYSIGTLIAEANNDTQKVRADDIFGNKYKAELESKIFNKFLSDYKNKIVIEYRFGEIADKKDKVHILTLLRPIVATGLLTKEKDIFIYTNQRVPIYKIFERLIQSSKNRIVINIISMLIPFLFEIRENYVKQALEKHKRELIRKYKEKAIYGELDDNKVIGKDIIRLKDNDQKLSRLIKTTVDHNIEHILPVLIFQLRNLIFLDAQSNQIKLTLPEDKKEEFIKGLTEIIYEKYVEKKLEGLPTSLTTVVRKKDFYEIGSDSYKTYIRLYKSKETDFIIKNRIII